KIDRKKGVLITTFLRAIGFESNAEIISAFYPLIEIDLSEKEGKQILEDSGNEIRVAEDILEPQTNEVIFEAGQELISQDGEKILSFGLTKIKIIDPAEIRNNRVILKCLDSDDVNDKVEAISKLHSVTRPGEPTTIENAEKEFQKLFFDPKRYNLGIVGRYKFNQKLYDETEATSKETILTRDDIVHTVKYLLEVYNGNQYTDDIDHLGNRRIRCVGELLVNQLKVGFARMERAIKERMNTEDIDEITPQKLISIKPISAVIKEFFGSSQLSQFMDQTNPLAELTHKRRLNALGPGGLSRERAGFEVRDVHYTHYGKICPIETPEGPNIGLILSLCNFAKVNDHGFLITPFRKVVKGHITDEINYLTAMEEDRYHVTQANTPVDDQGNLLGDMVVGRRKGEFPLIPPEQVDYMDVSPKQIISVSTALIPFLEHDDANRALMGSNMQRQAVPLMNTESPVVGTGMEAKAAQDSGSCALARRAGEVIKVSAKEIHIKIDNDKENPVDIYSLIKYRRTNQNTCFNQSPTIQRGERVEVGQLIADGPACDNGELALGRNVLVAFMSWEGANFEDAIIVSEKMVKEDFFTSLHIEEFEVDARETKLGSEKITRDIPNLSEEAFTNLDDDGIVRIGARVESGDILVGKVTPKGETESTPEYKLLHSIFGEKAREVKDTSLRVPHGNGGIVIGVNVFKRENGDDLPPGVEELIKVFVSKKRKLSEGDKMAGRHGNKGVISKIVPEEDMPYLPDGTPVDVLLNPLGVPSRMNLGQILETQLGWAGYVLGEKLATPVFEGAGIAEVANKLRE
ncbi:MAG: DNA-directed RNA polymerase subunit beta, partial [Spirochaetota bacterium]|nr:DNA-directed RNA polymerase subunit beta [Spirochaetota bacterium]